jgi:uncharacterized protein involved in outer membrane biogenesis
MARSRARRWLLIALIFVVVVGVAGVLLARWALDPATLKAVAEKQLSATLGQPVTVGAVRLAFFPMLSVEGTDISTRRSAVASSPSIDLRSVRLYPRLSSLLSKPVVIDRVDIEGLVLNVWRTRDGRWLLPLPETSTAGSTPESTPGPGQQQEAAVEVAAVSLKNGSILIRDETAKGRASTVTASITNINANLRRQGAVTHLDMLTASIGQSRVTGKGSLGPDGLGLSLSWSDLRASDLPRVFALLGTTAPEGLSVEGSNPLAIDLRVDSKGAISVAGNIMADRMALDTLTLTRFRTPVHFRRNQLTLDAIEFEAYGGTGRGRLTVGVATTPVSWALDGQVQGVDVNRLLSENTTARDKVVGTGQIQVKLQGTSRLPVERTITGTLSADISNGAIRDFPLLSAVRSAMKMQQETDSDLRFQTLKGTFDIADARATTKDLTARSGDVTLVGDGTIGFDQSIEMQAAAVFSQTQSAVFIRSVKELQGLANPQGEIQVPVGIGGTLAAPRFSVDVMSLLKKAATEELKKTLQDRLKSLIKK